MKKNKLIIISLLLWAGFVTGKILPLEDFTKPSEFTNVSISPDGKKLAGVMELDGMDKVAIIDLKNMKPLSAKTFGENRRVGNLTWANDDMILMSVNKRVGNLDRKGKWDGIYAMRFDGKQSSALFTGGSATQKSNTFGVSIIDGLVDDKKHILIREAKIGGAHVYKFNLKSKRRTMKSEPADKYSDAPSLNIKHEPIVSLAFDPISRNTFIYYKQGHLKNWTKLDLGGNKTDVTFRFGGNTNNPNEVYILSNHDASTVGVFKLNLTNGNLKLIYRNDIVDITGGIQNPAKETIGFIFMPGYPEILWVDKKDPIAVAFKGLQQAFPNSYITINNYTRDNNQMVFRVFSDVNPGEFYILDLAKQKIKPLVNSRPWVNMKEMSHMKPISITARDGVELHGYLTLPIGKEAKNLPLVVNPHGGPHGPRDQWGYNPEIQLMANRGYAVVQINFRGSGGYGVDFEKSGHMKWGREMQDDVTDATLWAIDQGIADKDRVCLYGGSYGGYATLQGLVREPDLYKCGIGYVGVYDLKKMRTCGDIASRGSSGKKFLNRVIGKDDAELKANSPSYNTDKIKAKVFIAHGEDDVRVPMCQLNSLVKSLEISGVDHEVMTRDEGHGYQDPQNKIDFYSRLLSFLDENIGH